MTQHDGWACSRVGWTIPATHAKANSLRSKHPIRTLTCRAISHSSVELGQENKTLNKYLKPELLIIDEWA